VELTETTQPEVQ